MKNRILKTGMALLMVGVLLAGIVIPAGAEAPYQSYLYDTKSQPVGSANAYSATRLITGQGLGVNRFHHLSDMVSLRDELDTHEALGQGVLELDKVLAVVPDGARITLETPKRYPDSLADFEAETRLCRAAVTAD